MDAVVTAAADAIDVKIVSSRAYRLEREARLLSDPPLSFASEHLNKYSTADSARHSGALAFHWLRSIE